MAFNMTDFFNVETKKEIKSDWKPIRISVHKLRPAAGKENFYHMDDKEIAETARTIELVGLQQYPVVKPVEGTDEYEIIAGHKRRLAILKLLSEGKPEYEMLPCKVEAAEDSIKNRLILIFTNSTQRERNDYEKMKEIKEVKELLTEWKKNNKLPDKMQNVIAEILGTNKTKVGTLENIDKNLIKPFKEEFERGNISTTAANEIAGLEQDAQQALHETYRETGALIAKDAKALKEDGQTKEQLSTYCFPDYLPENLKNDVVQYAEETGISLDEAADIVFNKQQRAQESEKSGEEIEFACDNCRHDNGMLCNYPETPDDYCVMGDKKESAAEVQQETLIDGSFTEVREPGKAQQPELPILKNNDQRGAFVDAYETWPVWIDTVETEERYYRYDLPDGSSMVVKVYFTRLFDYAGHDVKYEQRFKDGWGKHEYYLLESGKHFKDCSVNKSLLMEHLKEMQRTQLSKMKCKDCGQGYVHLDASCAWTAQCNLLGSSVGIGDCKMGGNCNEGTDCDNQDAPEWDCDLGQSNRYCIHHQN